MVTATRRPNALGFIASFPHQFPLVDSGTDILPVDGVAGANAWTLIGNPPYLDAIDTVNRIETDVNNAVSYEFTFADTTYPAGATILLNRLSIRCRGDGNDQIKIELWDGAGWNNLGIYTPPIVYGYRTIDVAAILNTRAKRDAAKVRFTYDVAGKANILEIDYAFIGISWELALPHWELVDDVTPDEDSTRIWTSETDSSAYSELYNIEDFVLPAGYQIDQIEVFARVQGGTIGGDSPRMKLNMRTNNNSYRRPIAFIVVTDTSYHMQSFVWALNPFTGAKWTEAEINALQIGLQGISSATPFFLSLTCTQVYVVITYSLIAVAKIQYSDGFVCVSVEA